ncbi:MAG: hypothetical protein AVDCRST_MAG89-4669, partial [uncultured Gemmatimonadetes bacterium]
EDDSLDADRVCAVAGAAVAPCSRGAAGARAAAELRGSRRPAVGQRKRRRHRGAGGERAHRAGPGGRGPRRGAGAQRRRGASAAVQRARDGVYPHDAGGHLGRYPAPRLRRADVGGPAQGRNGHRGVRRLHRRGVGRPRVAAARAPRAAV